MVNKSEEKFNKLMDMRDVLCRDDIVWILNYIKQKAADEDPALLGLHQPRLLKNFYHFAELAMLLIGSRNTGATEYDCIRNSLQEACFGLTNAQSFKDALE